MKKVPSFLIAMTMIFNILCICTLQAFAHSAMLEVTYDDCVDSKLSDSMYETWYVLDNNEASFHLSDQESTIKYYFEDRPNGTQSWADISNAVEIQNAYAESMKKWNNVYFYSYDSEGNVTKRKIINVIEGTEEDHNLSIFPEVQDNGNVAETQAILGYVIEEDEIDHLHYYDWEMGINIDYFTIGSGYSTDSVMFLRERTGAHELGHVLGLNDVDYSNFCGADTNEDHHHEILMGYGYPMLNRTQDITYKDIAGVAITRGFHTDEDHKWINCGKQNDETYKLLCSICNGVKYVTDLNAYSYVVYGSCAGIHALGTNHMFAVASYGSKDYYKCKYCRYVAPFSSAVTQNYEKIYFSQDFHKCENNVSGLEYSFYEEHCYSYITIGDTSHTEICDCNNIKTEAHYPFDYERNNKISHYVYCECGYQIGTSRHVVPIGGIGFKLCIYCGERLDTSIDITPVPGTNSVSICYITEAGSYVNADGVVFLADSDMTLLLEGQLDVEALITAALDNSVTE